MKHRTRAVAPVVRFPRRPGRRLAARLCVGLAAVLTAASAVHAVELHRAASPPERSSTMAGQAAMAGLPAPSASLGNDAGAAHRGAMATSAARREAAVGGSTAGSAPTVYVASEGRSLPESRTWALFGVGLLAVLMMARRQRQQHD